MHAETIAPGSKLVGRGGPDAAVDRVFRLRGLDPASFSLFFDDDAADAGHAQRRNERPVRCGPNRMTACVFPETGSLLGFEVHLESNPIAVCAAFGHIRAELVPTPLIKRTWR